MFMVYRQPYLYLVINIYFEFIDVGSEAEVKQDGLRYIVYMNPKSLQGKSKYVHVWLHDDLYGLDA